MMAAPTEEEVLSKIAALEESKQDLKNKISYLRKSVMDLETDLIGININLDKFKEQLKKIKHNQ